MLFSMHFTAGQQQALYEVPDGDLIVIPNGKLAYREAQVGDDLVSVTCYSHQDVMGNHVYTRVLLQATTIVSLVLPKDVLYSILLRGQDVRNVIDTYLPTNQKTKNAFHE